ncbi:probable ATP-dependent RNA helicase DDX43 [Anthonomus grandis grandis]|uniref:probable ATP-dependent RNA helicase DDX43 n=1 Tax=Anthonomus grandis grandis TaxID=2921223 RepID=UPI0021664006|nr:probable ATP-dependent RNA helicase DDX43 [Anthonomus grandis grandis]
MSDNWDTSWDTPAPVKGPEQLQNNDWGSGASQTFTNSNRRGHGGGGFRGHGGGDRDRRGHRGRTNDRGGWKNNDQRGWGGDSDKRSDNGGSWRQQRSNNWENNSSVQMRNREAEKCEVIKVPSRLVGKIIGRGGSQIEELQMRSSARINVTRDVEGDETIIKIHGDDQTIKRAKELIDEVIEERPKRAPVQEAPQMEIKSESKPEPYNWFKYLKECDAQVEAEWNKLPPIVKNFYQEHPEVTAMSEEEVEEFRLQNNNIVVDRTFKKPDSIPIPKPVKTFEQAFHNFPEILDEIYKAGFEKPSPIQSQAWPVLLSGEDLIGIAQTGTGKTLAFLLPALIHIDGQTIPREERGGPAVLIMAPTRELALQIDKEVKKYYYRGITSVCVYGGGDRKGQIDVVSRGVDIVIATPGRMNDLNEAGHLNVRSVTYVVLDEADRMLDMGFEPQIRKVMYSLRPTRQSIMTSATWPPGVRRLADSYMNDPIQVYVGSLDLAATHTVTQTIQILEEKDKEETFFEFISNMAPDDKMIVFCCTKAKADYLSVECAMKNISCASLHGNRDQCDREQAVKDIGDGTVKILIATDVASRGLDIDDITHVLNYDFPKNIEEYVHRVGRTGRAGKFGESISYFTRNDWGQAAELIKILEEAQQYVPEEIYSMAERFEAMKERREKEGTSGRGRGFGGRGGGRRW